LLVLKRREEEQKAGGGDGRRSSRADQTAPCTCSPGTGARQLCWETETDEPAREVEILDRVSFQGLGELFWGRRSRRRVEGTVDDPVVPIKRLRVPAVQGLGSDLSPKSNIVAHRQQLVVVRDWQSRIDPDPLRD
jgi:hypothetical protein